MREVGDDQPRRSVGPTADEHVRVVADQALYLGHDGEELGR
jgi:hypothetical protein